MIDYEKLDLVDEHLFNLLYELNDLFNLQLNFEINEHSHLISESRSILIDFIKEQKEES